MHLIKRIVQRRHAPRHLPGSSYHFETLLCDVTDVSEPSLSKASLPEEFFFFAETILAEAIGGKQTWSNFPVSF
jgi:hypothetical protein